MHRVVRGGKKNKKGGRREGAETDGMETLRREAAPTEGSVNGRRHTVRVAPACPWTGSKVKLMWVAQGSHMVGRRDLKAYAPKTDFPGTRAILFM